MSVLILNGSPQGARGNTGAVLEPFRAGLKAAGAVVEEVAVSALQVRPCRGCFACWRGGGQCPQDEDDMGWLRPKLAASETLVLATPLYVDHLPGPVKTVFDRTIPLAAPRLELVAGHCRHPRRRAEEAVRRVALLSVCGFYERDNFDVLVAWTQALCRNLQCDFAGALLRPHAYAFTSLPRLAPPKARVWKALQQAGHELATTGRISATTQDAVAAELLGRELYLRLANRSWRSAPAPTEHGKEETTP